MSNDEFTSAANDRSQWSQEAPQAVSLLRVFKVVLPLAVVILAGAYILFSDLQGKAQQQLEERQLERLLSSRATSPSDTIEFADENQDLLADFPPESECVSPAKLVFTYIPSDDPGDEAKTWQPLLDAIGEATSLPTEVTYFPNVDEQIAAMSRGELHVTAVNTGSVPQAVRLGGFLPVSTVGDQGEYGYTMNLLVRADSEIKQVQDLEGKKVTFVRPNSNSGFKAALVLLMNEHNLLPERDYQFAFSMGHDNSVKDLLAGSTDAAPVASDLFERMVAAGDVDADSVRSVYQSERFPPVALGYSHQLAPALREKVAQLLVEFDWSGTALAETYESSGATQFVPINYKDDWANIRRIDDAIEEARNR